MDLFQSLVSAVIGGGIVALLNLFISHRLAKNRDKENREAQERIQKAAEARMARTRDDDRAAQQREQEQRERISAVQDYFRATIEILESGENGSVKTKRFANATRLFALTAHPLDSNLQPKLNEIIRMMTEEEWARAGEMTYKPRYDRRMDFITNNIALMFDRLMLWAYSGNAHKVDPILEEMRKTLAALSEE